MGWKALANRSRPATLSSALDDEIAKLDLLALRGWQGVACLGLIVGICSAIVQPKFGLGPTLGVLPFLLFYVAVGVLAKRPAWRTRVLWMQVVVESALPWAFVCLLTRTQGAEYALGSWVPPMLYGGVLAVGILRMRPLMPIVGSVLGAMQYQLVYLLVVRGHLSDAALHMALFGRSMQAVRSLSIVFGGVAASALSFGLRRAISKAAKTARSQDLFGKYRIDHRIASGGMATVYAATYCPEGGFARPVAIKRIHPHLAREQPFVDAFRNEAELGARLVHPNLVQVLDFGRVEETYFLAMEYVDGVTLGALMRYGRAAAVSLSPPLVAWIGRQVLEGLVYSHTTATDEQGHLLRIVHRDLSPANVLVSKNGQVKISDFGIARALRGAAAYATVSVVGHMSYMAPEQATGDVTDERSDLFAIGAILWELLCGAPLFRRDHEAATLLAIVNDPIPAPSTVRPELARWDAFFVRALERVPSARYESARAMCDALLALQLDLGPPRDDELPGLVAHMPVEARPQAAELVTVSESATSILSSTEATRREGPQGEARTDET